MSASIFDLKNIIPTEAMLTRDLGPAKDWLNQIQHFIENNYADLIIEWKYYGQKSGWILKLLHKKRNILFVVPLHDSLKVVFTFGEKAFNLIFDSDVQGYIKQELQYAPKYAEGRTIQLHITSSEQLNSIFELIRIKLNS